MTSNGNGIAGVYEGSQLTSGITVVQSTTGTVTGLGIQSGGTPFGGGIPIGGATGTVKRVGWHETN
jgi:hypothetical protein